MGLSFLKQFKHTRVVNLSDKYFIIKCVIKDYYCEVGYIEKEFNETEFLNSLPLDVKNHVQITEVIEFYSKKQYKEYKKNQGLKTNF